MSQSVLGTLHGRAAVREFLESWWATWEDRHHHIEEIRDYGYGVVFIALLEDGRPVGREGRVQAQNVMVQEWVDGKTVRITSYADLDEAVLPPNASPTSGPMVEESATPDVFALMRSAFEAFNRRDFDVIPKIFAPDAVYDLSSTGLGIYEGLAEIRALFEEWWSAYDELDSELEEVVDLRNGVGFVALLQKGRPGRQHGGRTTTTGMGHGG